MPTVRELTAKLNFQIDSSQAEKFQRNVRDVNAALAAVKTSKFAADTKQVSRNVRTVGRSFREMRRRIRQSLKTLNTKLIAGGFKRKVGAWLKGAASAVKNKSERFVSNLGDFIKGINAKAAVMRTAAAAFAAAAASVILASSKEDAESVIIGKQGTKGLDRLKSRYKELNELSGGIFDEGHIAKASAGFLESYNNMDLMMDLLPNFVKIAKGSGQSLGEVMNKFASAIKGGSMESLTEYAGFATWGEDELEVIKNQGAGWGNMLGPARGESLKSRFAEKQSKIDSFAASREDDTSYKKRQLMGEAKGGLTDLGERAQPMVNEMLTGGVELIRWMRGKESAIPDFQVGGMMGNGGTVNNYNIKVETQSEAEHADKLWRAVKDTKESNDAKAPYKRGLNHGITG